MATRIKNIPFVGGDTATFEFDFGTKVAKSVAECPLKIYWSRMSTLQTPNSPMNTSSGADAGWFELGSDGNQNVIDTLKKQDGTSLSLACSTNGAIIQYMIELDLNQLCTALFGGSNAAMKAAMKKIDCMAYAKGSGTGGNLATMKAWSNGASIWAGLATNSSSSISAMGITILDNNCAVFVTNDNKMYVILYANASDGTIPSEVDLDYLNIKLQFARVPDIISPIPITLPDIWSLLIKGFSPAWDSTNDSTKNIVDITLATDHGYRIGIYFESVTKRFGFFKVLNGNYVLTKWLFSNVPTFNKFQSYNMLCEQTSSGLRLRLLKNGDNVEKYTNSNIDSFKGDFSLFVGKSYNTAANSDAFFNSVIFMPNRVFDDDAEAEAVLRSTAQGFEEDELFDLSKVNLDPHATIQGNSVVLNATATYQASMAYIPVLPNNQYELKFTINNSLNTNDKNYIDVYERYNTINILSHFVVSGSTLGQHDYIFTTGNKTNYLVLSFLNNITGTFTWSDISLKLKM